MGNNRGGEETRLRGDIKLVTGHTGKLPTKLTNKWSGPYPFVRMVGDRYAVILKKGEEVCHNVNRLWRHQPWDPDTGIAQEKDGGREEQKSVQGWKEKKNEGEQRPLLEGEVVVFVKDMTDNCPLPFGVGRILEVTGGQVGKFQWLGNSTFNARGTFLPGWLDPSDRRFYFQPRPVSRKHTEFTGEDESVRVVRDEIITDSGSLQMGIGCPQEHGRL